MERLYGDEMIPGYPAGSNIVLLNTNYINNSRELGYDSIVIVYLDMDTNTKHRHIINDPLYSYYKLKGDIPQEVNDQLSYAIYLGKENYELCVCKYRELLKDIHSTLGLEKQFFSNIKNGNYRANKLIHQDYRIDSTTVNINDFYRLMFSNYYPVADYSQITLKKAYLDIEVDVSKSIRTFVEKGEVPIHLVSLDLEYEDKAILFILRDNTNPLIAQFECTPDEDKLAYLHTNIDKSLAGDLIAKMEYGFDKVEIIYLYFDDEMELISSVFNILNSSNPDLCLCWNMQFDIPYFIERIKALGYHPGRIMSNIDYPEECQVAYYDYKEQYVEAMDRNEFSVIGSDIVYLCQLTHFAAINKTQLKKYRNFKLDNIGFIEAGMNKLEMSYSFRDIHYKNFEEFASYSLIDVFVMRAIERRSNLMNYIFIKTNVSCTRYSKVHNMSVFQHNQLRVHLQQTRQALVRNHRYKDLGDTSFIGGLTISPTNMNTDSMEEVGGYLLDV